MVQTSQTGSFLPAKRSVEADALLIRFHEAENLDKLSKATFALMDYLVPHQFLIMLFRPLEFELPCRFNPAKYKGIVDAYMAREHKHDLWLRRSPVHPGVTVVRHGNFTPASMLHRSAYYKRVLEPLGSKYGASVVAWRGSTWLATLTVMRNGQQGEFTDEHMEELLAFQPHFACAIRRMAGYQETRLIDSSLRRFMSSLPTATIILDWNLRALHFNGIATQLCAQWKHGARASLFKAPRRFQVPGDIMAVIEQMKPTLGGDKAGRSHGTRSPVQITHAHPSVAWLHATIEFVPSRSLALSKGTFLVTLKEDPVAQQPETVSDRLNLLSRRERECAELAAEGLHNIEIAKRLGKSQITVRNQLTSIYKKLGIDSRHKLIAAFARLSSQPKKSSRTKTRSS